MNRMVWLSLAGAALMCGGCEEKSPAPGAGGSTGSGAASGLAGAADKVGSAVESAKEQAAEAFTKLRDNAVAALEPRLADAKKQVSGLKEKVAGLPAAVKPTVESGLKEVEKQMTAAEEQFGKLKTAGADTWESLSKDLSGTLDKLMTSIKDLTGKLPG